jgi:hypothetical protein
MKDCKLGGRWAIQIEFYSCTRLGGRGTLKAWTTKDVNMILLHSHWNE